MIEKIIDEYKKGKCVIEISKKFKKNKKQIENILIKNEVFKKSKINFENEINIKEMILKNYSSQKIKNKFNIDFDTLKKICYKFNLKLPYNETNNKYEYNEEIFEVIDTEEKAYWLGFLYADGSNHYDKNIVLSLKESDEEHLKKFTNFCIKENGEKRIDYNSKTKSKRIIISCKKITMDLIDKGLIRNKSFKIKFQNFDNINKDLTRHFIRGYFDGDGNIDMKKNFGALARIVGNEDFLKELEKYLKKELKIDEDLYFYQKKNQKVICLTLRKLKYSKLFLDYLYKNCNIYLERKYQRFLITEKWRPGVKTKRITG